MNVCQIAAKSQISIRSAVYPHSSLVNLAMLESLNKLISSYFRVSWLIIKHLTLASGWREDEVLRGIHINVRVFFLLHVEQLLAQGLERGPVLTVV